jgi:formylglycine-generating enzyme required for sulfatase activity
LPAGNDVRRGEAHSSAPADVAWVTGGAFRVASEAIAHDARVSGFFIDIYPVANRQFATIVSAAGHRTVTEFALDRTQ